MSKLFSPDIEKYIRDNVKGIGNEELTKRVNETFSTSYSVGQVKRYKKRNKLSSGLTGRFEKGHEPPNKGKKGVCPTGCEKGWFKKGTVPHNHRPIGSERIDKDGYVLVKVEEHKKWKLKHRVIWEQHNGSIPKGCVVIFLDGDIYNFDINNLALVSRNELRIMNQMGLKYDNAETTKTGIAISKLIIAKTKRNKSD